MDYNELTRDEYRNRTADMVQHFEGFRARPYDAKDGKATIGYGYTFNRDNNVELFDQAQVPLSADQRRFLASIDQAPAGRRTELGLRAPIELSQKNARDLLALASLDRYETPANNLAMPFSDERGVVVSLTYNRGEGRVSGQAMQPFREAIQQGNRAEAWFQLRYNSWGTSSSDEAGLRKRRYMEAQIFGLYDDPQNVSREEAVSAYSMFQLHRPTILALEKKWGVGLDGASDRGGHNLIALANRDYRDLVEVHGAVPTIAEALTPARDRLLQDLRSDNPDLAQQLRNDEFPPMSVFVDPGRDLRVAPFPKQRASAASWPNSSAEERAEDHDAVLDSRAIVNGVETSRRDLLVGGGGDDTLRGGLGADVLLGGNGNDRYEVGTGDLVKDSDGRGCVSWGARSVVGGTLRASGHYKSTDGEFDYAPDVRGLTITDRKGESVRIEGFENGQLGIELQAGHSGAPAGRAESDIDAQLLLRNHPLYPEAERAVRSLDQSMGRMSDAASERMTASVLGLAVENRFTRIDHVVLSEATDALRAGHNVFVVQGKLDDAASKVAHMPTADAVQRSVEQCAAAISASELQNDWALPANQAQPHPQSVAPTRALQPG